eukprot:scaffold6638_cov120-Skeletonema_menzelii.AAC.5
MVCECGTDAKRERKQRQKFCEKCGLRSADGKNCRTDTKRLVTTYSSHARGSTEKGELKSTTRDNKAKIDDDGMLKLVTAVWM